MAQTAQRTRNASWHIGNVAGADGDGISLSCMTAWAITSLHLFRRRRRRLSLRAGSTAGRVAHQRDIAWACARAERCCSRGTLLTILGCRERVNRRIACNADIGRSGDVSGKVTNNGRRRSRWRAAAAASNDIIDGK